MKVFITRRIPGKAIEGFQGKHEVVISSFDRPLAPQEIIDMGKGADAVLTLLTDRWTAEMMDGIGANLKIISNYAVGFDNIDVKAATERGIVVTNTSSDEVNESVAEFTWALILSLSRRLVEGDEYARKGAYRGWEPDIFLGRDVYGKTLGIVGLGKIGTMVASRAKGFKMKILYNKRDKDKDKEKELGIEFRELDQLLTESDYVTLHVPLTPETTHLINKDTLSKMKPAAYLINTSRGPVVDEHALADALRQGKIAGAALDVHENEPSMNPEMMQMENAILTPHIASATVEGRGKMTEQAVDSILKVLSGEKPDDLVFVNKEVWERRRGTN
ncbi:MAG: D-glycerate dehydrogenase [Candidatus Blackburnbacteria bacterium]|nr:D-glycerate dehydrogenase [Candidatus Blackburnbacteria bacterium]